MVSTYVDGLVCPVGTSGPVVTECVDYFYRRYGAPPKEIHLLVSESNEVKRQADVVELALKKRYKKIVVKKHLLSISDIDSQEGVVEYMKSCKKAITMARETYPAARVGVLISGGRKTQSVATAFLGAVLGVETVLHVYAPIESINEDLERMRGLIQDVANAEDKEQFYEQHLKMFERLFFPPPENYEIIELMVPPISPRFIERVVEAFEHAPLGKEKLEEFLSDEEIDACVKRGFLVKNGSMFSLSERGEMFLKVFE